MIICHFEEGGDDLCQFLSETIPVEKLIVLDKKLPEPCPRVATIYQDFEQDIYKALVELNPRLRKYRQLKMLRSERTYHPVEIKKGFIRFCGEYAYDFGVVEDVGQENLEPGTAYISLKEDDLVTLLKKISASGLKLGGEVGIISYNDTPVKEILREGITVISTDFENLGRQAADMVLGRGVRAESNPFYVISRNSL